MEREIVFLDGQIGQAAKKKYQLAKIADQSKLTDQSKVGDQSEFSSRETFEKLPKFTQQKVTDTSGKKDPIRQKKAQSIYEKVSQFSH